MSSHIKFKIKRTSPEPWVVTSTLKYINKQDFKTKDTFDLLSDMPVLNSNNERLDTIFVKNSD